MSEKPELKKCPDCDGRKVNSRDQRCLTCNGTGNYQEPEIIEDNEQYCEHCGHSNFTDPPLDDLEAACCCDCHDAIETESGDELELFD